MQGRVDAHEVGETLSLVMHRIFARHLSVDPGLASRALARLPDRERHPDRDGFDMSGVTPWRKLLEAGDMREVRRAMTARGETYVFLRSRSPFYRAGGPDMSNVSLRFRMRGIARRIVERRHGYPLTFRPSIDSGNHDPLRPMQTGP